MESARGQFAYWCAAPGIDRRARASAGANVNLADKRDRRVDSTKFVSKRRAVGIGPLKLLLEFAKDSDEAGPRLGGLGNRPLAVRVTIVNVKEFGAVKLAVTDFKR